MNSIFKLILLLGVGAGSLCIVGFKSAKGGTSDGLPHFALARADIVSSVEIVTNGAGKVEVQFKLSNAKADELRKFSLKNSQAPELEIVVGSTAIMKPGMQSEIALSNGVVRVFSPSSDSRDVRAIGESLRK
jgi:hypothetical protein